MKLLFKEQYALLLPILGSAVLYIFFAYFLEREEFVQLLTAYNALFICAYWLIEHSKANFWLLAGLGVLFRLLFLPAIPNLSQDFYRFVWDGQLMLQAINPYLLTPEQWTGDSSLSLGMTINHAEELVKGMGDLNASHYSNYAPVNQFFFMISALFAKGSILGSVVVLRLIMLLADIGILYFGRKLLLQLQLPVKNIFWYFLSPFIIIELTGNLHFEGVMLFFLIWSLYLLFNRKWIAAGILIGISISVKLLPLLLLPLFLQWFTTTEKDEKISFGMRFDRLSVTRTLLFYLVVLGTVIITFAPFLSLEFISNFAATIGLWFQNFEFNASVYYIIRWIGFETIGWNIIETVGKILPVLIILFILGLSFFRTRLRDGRGNTSAQQLTTAMLFAVSFYFLLSTTVHPWYVATPLLLSIFTRYRYVIVWSFMVFLSYSAYGAEGFQVNLWWVALEYAVVIGMALIELLRRPMGLKSKRFTSLN